MLSEEIKKIINYSIMIKDEKERKIIISIYKQLLPQIEKLEYKIEKMRNCYNCKYYFLGCSRNQILNLLDEECIDYNKWESEIEE